MSDSSQNDDVASSTDNLYKPPAHRDITQLINQDEDDESLKRYKERLIPSTSIIIDPNDPRNVIPLRVAMVFDEEAKRDPIIFDLKVIAPYDFERQLSERLTDKVVVVKQGVNYNLRLEFYVQRDIVTGLQYVIKMKGKLLSTSMKYMAGSRAPAVESYVFNGQVEQAPTGMMARGKYHMTSILNDDYGNEYAKFNWTLKIAADWGNH